MTQEALKACPFCGGEANAVESGERFYVSCGNLDCFCCLGEVWDGYCMPDHAFPEVAAAVAAWNTRAAFPQPQGDGWLPIEAAPRDRQIILFNADEHLVEPGYWCTMVNEGGGFWEAYNGDVWHEGDVTHWRPLPDPPAALPPSIVDDRG